MGSRPAAALLQLPVRLHGIRLGQPVDVLLETEEWRAIGFLVLCGDETQRFLPIAAAQPGDEEITVASALMLLEDIDFYLERAASLRALLGGEVSRDGRPLGSLRDLLLDSDGAVRALVVEGKQGEARVAPHRTTVSPRRATAA